MKRLLAALAVALAACAPAAEQSAPPAAGDPTGPPATAGDVEPVAPSEAGAGVPGALAWEADLVGDGQLSGGDLAGGDVALWFWAPW